MIDLNWLDRFPSGKVEEGVKILDKLYWPITVIIRDSIWNVFAGEALIFRTDSRESLDAFLYGLALTYVTIDSAIIQKFSDELKKWVE